MKHASKWILRLNVISTKKVEISIAKNEYQHLCKTILHMVKVDEYNMKCQMVQKEAFFTPSYHKKNTV